MIHKILEENKKRLKMLNQKYDPYLGLGSSVPRRKFRLYNKKGQWFYIPKSMDIYDGYNSFEDYCDDNNLAIDQVLHQFVVYRIIHDFEFFCVMCVKIKDKESEKIIPFVLRKAQLKLLKQLEIQRVSEKPIRIILTKARQWGGSTLIQIYMAWLQLMHKKNWNSVIAGDVEAQAINVRSMYTRLIENIPKEIANYSLANYENSQKNKWIPERGCVIRIGSAQKPDTIRSSDIAMAHLTEVGLWKTTQGKSPDDMVQSILGTIPSIPYSLFIMESTAKGVGNYFHSTWLKAKRGENNMKAVFVSWFEIELYQKPFKSEAKQIKFFESLNSYEKTLWKKGATLEGINWYREKFSEFGEDLWRMQSEFPSNDREAFQSTGRKAFSPAYIVNLRELLREPELVGDVFPQVGGKDALEDVTILETKKGNLQVWRFPDDPPGVTIKNRYCAFVDIGGRTEKADYSAITVIDRIDMMHGGLPVRACSWRGHLDQDLFAWKAVQIAKIYDNALLAVEVNSLQSKGLGAEGNHYLTILDEISEHYDNLFMRTSLDQIREGQPKRYGFHTNKASKTMMIDNFNKLLRERAYEEYDERVYYEADYYELKADGSMGAVDGQNDDMLISTMGALWLATSYMDPCVEVDVDNEHRYIKRRTSFEEI